MLVCHRCDNPVCDEITHLFLGTAKENTQDCIRKERFRYHPENLSDHYHPHPGEKNGLAKLTERQVREIRASTESSLKLGPRYGVSFALICRIRRRECWRHVA